MMVQLFVVPLKFSLRMVDLEEEPALSRWILPGQTIAEEGLTVIGDGSPLIVKSTPLSLPFTVGESLITLIR